MRRLRVLVMSSLGVASGTAHARSDEPCGTWMFRRGTFDATWESAIEAACASLSAMKDRDETATVEVVSEEPIRVRLSTKDGRVAERTVTDPALLTPVLEALLVVPGNVDEAEKLATEVTPTPTPKTEGAGATDARPTPSPPAEALAPASTPIEVAPDLGADLVARFQGGAGYVALGARVVLGLDIDGWLVQGTGRLDPGVFALDGPNGFEMVSYGGGVAGGRRFSPTDVLDVDVGIGLDVVNDVQHIRARSRDENETDRERQESSSVDLRPGAWLKASARSDIGLAFVGSVGFELSPLRIADEKSALLELPPWGLTLGVGIGWSP